jgi:hypothetical protein
MDAPVPSIRSQPQVWGETLEMVRYKLANRLRELHLSHQGAVEEIHRLALDVGIGKELRLDRTLFSKWVQGKVNPRPEYVYLLCLLCDRAPAEIDLGDSWSLPFDPRIGRSGDQALGETNFIRSRHVSAPVPIRVPADVGLADVQSFTAWARSSNTSDDAIESLAAATSDAAQDHAYRPPATVLANVLVIHRHIQAVLQDGKQLTRQCRELFRIDAALLAHVSLLLGDLRQDKPAAAFATAATVAAGQAGSSPAEAFSAQAQIARWRHRYTEAADLAAKGFACSPRTSLRVLLACQEANAAALARDPQRVLNALARAEAAHVDATSDSAWSCPPARYALYRLSTALHSGDPVTALREAAEADAAWLPGHARPFGTWAHTRIAAGFAHLMLGSVDGAADQIGPVLELPDEYRLVTLTEHMASVDRLLEQPRFRGAREVARLRDRIAEFMHTGSAAT